MASDLNQMWRLARTPPGGLPEADDFRWDEAAAPEPGPGQALTRTLYLSLDPYQWGRRRGGLEQPGDVCHGRTVAQVVRSRLPEFPEGAFVFNTNGWQTHGLIGADVSVFGYMFPRVLDPAVAPISTAVGVLGMLGLTAYSGLVVQCQPRRGETAVISAASGGVGQVAGQLARHAGCRVVGIAGAPEKCAYVTRELGLDACVSHRSPSFADDLAAACPDGVDIYFENVGGPVFRAVLPLLTRSARITLCGLISQYANTDGGDPFDAWRAAGQATFEQRGVQVHKLFVRDFVERYQARFLREMAALVRDGRVVYREDVWEGLREAPDAFRAVLTGRNFGKALVAVSDDPTLDAELRARRAAGNTLGRAGRSV